VDFGPEAPVDIMAVQLRWFDHWLQGRAGLDQETPVKIFVMGRNRWRFAKEYPLPGTRYRKLYLHSDGGANSSRGDGRLGWNAPPADSPADRYLYDPDNPVPSLGGNNCCGTPTPAGPVDQRPVEQRRDVLVYTSDILEEEVEVTGPVKLVLYASSDAPDTDFVAKLVDVYPDGKAINVAEGILRARYRNGADRPEPLQENRVYTLTIDLVDTSNAFLPGHRIRLDVTSSHFPQFDRNPNTGEAFGTGATTRPARQTIHHSAAQPSHLVLPIIPAE
jgi:putative CocE/NonD family hydrolase